ncbi:MAG TPA: hypothetical protein VGL15_09305, partial [Vicinamibacteria bacterium]
VMRKVAGFALALALVGSSAMAAPLPGFVPIARTAHFTFYGRGGAKVDAGRTERYVEQLEGLLGQRVAGTAEYYRYDNAQEVAAGTGTFADGVTFAHGGQVHSTLPFHAHELVHLVAGQLGNPGAFFHEGLAVALGDGGRWRGQRVNGIAKSLAASRGPLSAVVTGFASLDPEVAYPLAGSFVGRLIEKHGLPKVSDFFRKCPAGGDPQAAFAAVFGETLDEAGRSWFASL